MERSLSLLHTSPDAGAAHQRLPVELLRQILIELASQSRSSARLASSLSRATRQWTHVYLHQSIAIRSRSQLRRLVRVLALDESRRSVLRCVYVNNRAEPIDGGVQAARRRRQRRWNRPQLREEHHVEGGAEAWGGAAPGIDEEGQGEGEEEEEDDDDDDDDEWPALAIGFLFRHCPNLENVHIHEPFSINYPSEISSVFHLVAYPLDVLRSPAQSYEEILYALSTGARDGVTITTASTQRFAKPTMPRLKELTISALALKPEHLDPFDRLDVPVHTRMDDWTPALPLPPHLRRPSPLASLERLHLHWPTFVSPLVEALLPLPRLTHLRLTRPSPHGLVSGVRHLLSQKVGLKLLIVELGWYLEGPTLDALGEMEDKEVLRCIESQAELGEIEETEAGPPPEAETERAQEDGFVLQRHPASRLRLLGRDRERKIWQQGWLTGAYDEEGALREFWDRSDRGVGCWGWR